MEPRCPNDFYRLLAPCKSSPKCYEGIMPLNQPYRPKLCIHCCQCIPGYFLTSPFVAYPSPQYTPAISLPTELNAADRMNTLKGRKVVTLLESNNFTIIYIHEWFNTVIKRGNLNKMTSTMTEENTCTLFYSMFV